MSIATTKSSFAKLNRNTSPVITGGQIRLRENYLRQDLLLPHFLQEDCFFILPTSSSLDSHLETILSCGEVTSKALVLGSVLARLKMLGYLKTLQKVKKLVLHDPTRSWLGLADDHLSSIYISTLEDDEPGLMKTTLRFLFEWFPQAHFCVLSETKEFRDEMSGVFPELSILSVKQFCALYCPNVYVEEEETDEKQHASRNNRLLQAANGRRKSGKLRCVNSKLAFVGMDCLVVQRNKAMHGDTVEIEPCDDVVTAYDDDVEVNPNKFTTKYQVVAIVKRDDHRRNLVCTLDVNEDEAGHHHGSANLVCIPMDQRYPKLIIPHSKLARALAGKRFLVEVLDWPENCRYPNARYLRTIGTVGEVATESSCILIETGLAAHDLPFSAQALAELPQRDNFEFKLTSNEMDLRSRRVVSIDPIGCQDIDDAISIERNDDGSYELAVHIADVDRFVRSGSALDREASARATSVYLEERRLDMLPSLLCENLCSLRPQTDRFAVSVMWKVDAKTLQVCSPAKFTKSMIHSRYALAYEQAQNLADGKPAGEYLSQRARGWTGGEVKQDDYAWLTESICMLMEIARKREQQRVTSGGAINLSNDREEVSFKPVQVANADAVANAEQIKLNACEHLEIHNTIAELMILANEAVAKHLLEICPSRALLRIHPPSSDPIKFQSCVEFCSQLGIKFDYTSNRTIAASLDLVRARYDRATAQYVESLTTRAMSEAQYVCAGTTTSITAAGGSKYSAYFHFGLGLEAYTHFTSPIRRYADLVVARQIFDVPAPLPQQVTTPPPPKPVAPAVQQVVEKEEEEDLSWANALGGGSSSDDENDSEIFQVIQPVAPPAPAPVVMEPQFKPALDQQHTHSSTQTVQAICDHINIQHRAAKEASHKSTELFLSLFLRSSHEKRRYLGLLSSIRANSGMVVFFVPTFDLKVAVKLVLARNGIFDRDAVIEPAADRISSVSLTEQEVTFTIANSDRKLVYKLRDQIELELFVEEKDLTAPRMSQVQARLVLAAAAAPTAASAKPFTALLESLKPSSQQEEEKRTVTISDLFAQARRLRSRSTGAVTPSSSKTPPMLLPGARACFGGFVAPKFTLAFSPAVQSAVTEEEEEEEPEVDLSRHYMSSMSASAVTKTQVQQLEREATRRIAKLQAEKFESRTKRRMKKGE